MKKVFSSLAVLLVHGAAFAQETVPAKTFWNDPLDDPLTPLYVVSALMFVVTILVVVVAVYMVRVVNFIILQAEKEMAVKEGRAFIPPQSMWSKLTQSLNASVPVSQEKDIDLGHNFDGIRELDNHLPPWWKWLFVGTIGWAVVYFVMFHVVSSLPLSIQEYDDELAVATEQAIKLKASQPAAVIDENTLTYTADAESIAKGKVVFDNTCVACHRADGGGNTIGPNLTDEYWIHGGGVKNIFITIKNGKVDKGMPEWGRSMSALDVRNVAFYVLSLEGTSPANAKAPQGEIYKPEKEVVVKDSLVQATR